MTTIAFGSDSFINFTISFKINDDKYFSYINVYNLDKDDTHIGLDNEETLLMMRALKSALNFDKTKASLTIPVPLSATKKIKESIIFTVDSENIHVEINFRNIHSAGYLENHLQSIRDWINKITL